MRLGPGQLLGNPSGTFDASTDRALIEHGWQGVAAGYSATYSRREDAILSSLRLLFFLTLFLLVGFTVSFGQTLGMDALPWIISLWLVWGLGVAWVRARGWG